MTTPDNTPAFPSQLDYGDGQITSWTGMTLRDYFAAKAMQGFAADPNASWKDGVAGMAKTAYQWADAMMGLCGGEEQDPRGFHALAATMQAALDAPAPTEDPMLACDIAPRPLEYPLSHYHLAIGGGPLHFTWKDKPHRLVYDLIAAVKHYAQRVAPTAEPQPDKGCMNRLHGESEGDLHIAYMAGYGKGRQDGAKESQRVPLTEGQIFDLAGNYDCGMLEKNDLWVFTSPKQLLTFVRAIEAASIKEGS